MVKVISEGPDDNGTFMWTWSDGRKTSTVYRFDDDFYPTLAEATEAVRLANRWQDVVTSNAYAIGTQEGKEGSAYAVSCYPTEEECDADQEGAHAPRVEVLSGNFRWALGYND